jgi:cell division protein FtsL
MSHREELIMVDWAGGIEARNYSIKHETDMRNLAELLWIILSLVMVAAVLLFYIWVRSHIVNTGYESQNLQSLEESLRRTQNSLILEEETLKNPERIDMVARNELGMIPLRPNQLIAPQTQDVAPSALAMANPRFSSSEPRRSSATY